MGFRKGARNSILTVCIVGAVAVSTARASTVAAGTASFTETLPFSTTLTGFSQYNGPLPLIGVEFMFTTNLTGTATVISGPGNPTENVDLNFASALQVFDPTGTNLLITASPTASAPISVPGDGSSNTFDISGSGLTAAKVLINPALLASFVGSGTVSLPVSGSITVGFTPHLIPPFSVPTATGTVSGTLDVIYILAPEPSTVGTIVLGGLVVAAFCLLRRRAHPLSSNS